MNDSAVLRVMESCDLADVLEWRNDPKVRQFMYTQHEITMAEHREWFSRVRESESDHLLVMEAGDVLLGFVRLNIECTRSARAQWGFFRAPAAPRGTGQALCERALAYAFEDLGLHKVYGEVLEMNIPSQKVHHRLGFTHEARFRDHFHDGERYWDAIGFGLLAGEWSQRKDA